MQSCCKLLVTENCLLLLTFCLLFVYLLLVVCLFVVCCLFVAGCLFVACCLLFVVAYIYHCNDQWLVNEQPAKQQVTTTIALQQPLAGQTGSQQTNKLQRPLHYNSQCM